MRRRAIAIGLLAGLTALPLAAPPPPARAQGFSCPNIGEATLWEEQAGTIEEPSDEFGEWSFACIYSLDGYDAGAAGVVWYEQPVPYPYCPVGFQSSGTINSAAHAASAWTRVGLTDPGYPTEDQLKGLAQALMAAAEARAALCGEVTPSPPASPSPSPSASPSPSPSPSNTLCVVNGKVTDHEAEPVAGVRVLLSGPGMAIEGVTDEEGNFEFRDIAAAAPAFDPATDQASLILYLEKPGKFKFHYKTEEVEARTTPFKLQGQTCTKDIKTADAYAAIVPVGIQEWKSLWVMYHQLERAFDFVELELGDTLDYLPLKVNTWCDSTVDSGCDGTAGAFYRGSSTLGAEPAPVMYVEVADSVAKSTATDDTMYHEFGHHVMSDVFNPMPLYPDRKAHGGYYPNVSSNDSWVEGFASFYALMVAKHNDGEPEPKFRHPGGSSEALEPNFLAWSADGKREEFAVTGLLVDFEDGSSDYLENNPPVEKIENVKHKVLTTPDGNKVVVGKLNQLRKGAMALVFIELLDGSGKRIRAIPIYVDGTNEDLRSGQGVVFWSVIPKGVKYSSLKITGLKEKDNDDDPIDIELVDLWSSIVDGSTDASKPGKPDDYIHVFDVHELYDVLKADFGGTDADADGIDDVDQVFIMHGFHEDTNGSRTHDPGERPGLTSHPPIDEHWAPSGPSVERHDVKPLTEHLATIDTGGVAANFMVQIDYGGDRAADGYTYVATPDADGRVPVAVPDEGSGGEARILALADGHLPEVVAEIKADDFWTEARANPDESFMSFSVALQPGSVSLEEASSPLPAILLIVGGLAAAVGGFLLLRRRPARLA